ncbi:threonine/homoserine/homoserine lactone efflux protein [Desulfurispira natronophila]|uniref:Threonine/homoserine/homoserine lactone efflux protein n=2 Tax=Desulfurispira natronophila TaxID=682562 RepID=A0A7W8DHQ9_9BACT|nr:threonine/homoserine/homoserine lactone efflux protein [Desulfurispira natronophila]
MALVISHTLQFGLRSGVKVALAPLVSDAPIIILTLLFFTHLSHLDKLLGVVSLFGSLFLLRMAYESFCSQMPTDCRVPAKPRSLQKGVLANFLSPHPYLFWLTVGGPIMANATQKTPLPVFVFILTFYFFIVGSKVVIALLVGQSRDRLRGGAYRLISIALAAALAVLALMLLRDGLHLLDLW